MSYDVERLKGPRMAGTPLRVFASLVEHPLTGGTLRRLMLQTIGVARLRRIAAHEAPAVAQALPGLLAAAVQEGAFGRSNADGERSEHTLERNLADALTHALEDALPPLAVRGFRPETARDFTEAYRSGRTDPLAVAERVIEAIAASERREPPMRIFIAHDPDDVRAQARASAERWQKGEPIGPLDGVPVAIKDEVDQRGYGTSVGTAFLGGHKAERDATAVARLRAAGALLIGKANMHEIGLGITGLNPHHGTPRNPYDPTRHTGGSSSGSAAAVAAGLCPLALGADGGGSIRIPAALCGQVGLMGTFGRVSEHGAAEVCWSVAHIGPIGASVRDVALGYLVMAGPDPADPATHIQPPPHIDQVAAGDVSGLRLGIYRAWFEDADPALVAACRAMLERFEAEGAKVVEIEIPELGLVQPVHAITIASEMAAAVMKRSAAERARFGIDVRLLLALTGGFSSSDYVHAQRLRTRICRHFLRAFEAVDLIVTPTTAAIAPPIASDALATGESNFDVLDRMMRFVVAPNLTGHPAISFPVGYDASGLPIGMQAIGKPWAEHTLLRLAVAAERELERLAPAVHYRLLEEA